MISLIYKKGTENEWIPKVDTGISNWICRVNKTLSLPIELDCVGGFVYSASLLDQWRILQDLGLDSYILFVHVLDMVNREGRCSAGECFRKRQ